jgi:uncharacterized protein YbjT (DUF2867 family)
MVPDLVARHARDGPHDRARSPHHLTNSTPRMPSALLVGASGLVGRELLLQLMNDPAYDRVVVLARRQMPSEMRATGKLVSRMVDFDRLADHDDVAAVDHVFCALGTTMKQAGSRDAFRLVDYHYPLEVARMTRAAGARHFALVSALGADAGSRVFYNRVKGEVERDVALLGWPGLTIVRPSLLLGDRHELRLGEEIGKRLAPLVPRKWKPIHARKVAAAMVRAAKEERAGTRVLESAMMQ